MEGGRERKCGTEEYKFMELLLERKRECEMNSKGVYVCLSVCQSGGSGWLGDGEEDGPRTLRSLNVSFSPPAPSLKSTVRETCFCWQIGVD